MPIHDWTRVRSGIFNYFHNRWINAICDALNERLLPPEIYALTEQDTGPYIPDGIALERSDPGHSSGTGGVQVAPVRAEIVTETELPPAQRQRSVVLHHITGDRIVAMIEIVSPGNKDGEGKFALFVEKAIKLLASGIHLLILDILPRGRRDPNGIPGAIWDEIGGPGVTLPTDRPFTLASYETNGAVRAFIETRAMGTTLPVMPLFLEPGRYVQVPLEETYAVAYQHVPQAIRGDVERPPEV